MFGMRAKDDPAERGRLGELTREEIRTARLRVRCERDRSVVAVVYGDCIVTLVERVRRDTHDHEITAPCRRCDLRATYTAVDGRRRPQAERLLSSRAVWHEADNKQRHVTLDRVLSGRFAVSSS